MGLKDYQEQRSFSYELERHEVAKDGVNLASGILEMAENDGRKVFSEQEYFFAEIDGQDREVQGHQYSTKLSIGGAEIEVIDRIFDHPERNSAVGCYIIRGDELFGSQADTSSELEGPFGFIFYVDDAEQTIENVQARCFINGETDEAPNEAMQETLANIASAVKSKNATYA